MTTRIIGGKSVAINGTKWREAVKRLKRRAREQGAVCGICGQPFDWSKRFPDGESFSADHWPVPAHRLEKVSDYYRVAGMRPAHLSCNSAEGGRMGNAGTRQAVRIALASPYSKATEGLRALHDGGSNPAGRPGFAPHYTWSEAGGCWSPASRQW